MQENPQIARENINRFFCDNCGANMIFDPRNGQLTCPYCNFIKIDCKKKAKLSSAIFIVFCVLNATRLQPMAQNAMQVSCETCGATVTFVPPETARSCDFCGGKIVAQPKSADPLVAPEGVLPFSVTSQNRFVRAQNLDKFALVRAEQSKTFAQPDKVGSIYIPYWTFDADTYSRYTGQRGEYYYQTEYYEENGERKSRQVRHTNWYDASGAVSRHFDDIYIPATKSVLPNISKKLNWEFNEFVPYEPAYLAGHKAQTYQVPLEEGFELFKQIAAAIIYNDVRHDIGGDEQRIGNVDTDYSNVTFKHLLLPVYAGAYRYNNKVFQIVVNGRTGEVQGERPYSWLKIGCLVYGLDFVLL